MNFDKDELGLPWNIFVGNGIGRGLVRLEHEQTGDHIASFVRGKTSELKADFIMEAANQYFQMREALERIERMSASLVNSPTKREILMYNIRQFSEIATESLNQLTQRTK